MEGTFSRRSVISGLIATCAAGIAGYFVARTSGAANPSPTSGANGYGANTNQAGRYLAKVDQVPAGGGVILSNDEVVLVRKPDGSIHGLSAICTHQGCTVGTIKHGVIICPCHGSHFNVQTGAVIAGPATRPLPAVPVVVRAGRVYSR